MKTFSVVAAVVLAGIAISAAVWIAKRGSLSVTEGGGATEDSGGLPISPTGPWPKVVAEQTTFDFGIMEVGQKSEHSFKVTNTGEADLLLKTGSTTCQCTLSQVGKDPIPPGKTAEITLTWQPNNTQDMFQKSATIYTNDPKRQVLNLQINGSVMDRLLVSPAGTVWEISEVSDSEPVVFQGAVYSRTVPSFTITAKSADPAMTAEVIPMTSKELEELGARGGHAVKLVVAPDRTAGNFAYPLHIRTSLKERLPDGSLGTKDMTVDISVRGARRGAIRFFGQNFDGPNSTASLGSFEAKDGRTREYKMYVTRAPKEGLVIESIKVQPELLAVKLTPDPDFKTGKAQTYTLSVGFPPGGPLIGTTPREPATITILTNHPEVRKITINVTFNAY